MVKGTIRQTVTLDFIINRLADSGLKGIRLRTLIILRMGLYALREMDSVPDHAAVNESVALARKTAKGTDKFINAVLRSYIRSRDEYEVLDGSDGQEPPFLRNIKDRCEKLSVRYSFPVDIIKLICSQYGDQAEKILVGLNTPTPVILRVNTLRTSREDLIELLKKEGIKAEAIHGSELAVLAEGSGIISSDMFRKGYYSIQSLSSMMAVEALAPAAGSNVLDLCAAPGGKSTMMAEMMGNCGSITACDIHEHRLKLIEAYAARLGVDIIETCLMDAACHNTEMEGQYDYVLADVPCSGLGVMSTKPEIRLRADMESIKQLPGLQLSILRNALRYAKPGGKICYSTCTLNKQENEEITAALAAEDPTFGRIVEMNTILPYNNMIGFYYCIIEKSMR